MSNTKASPMDYEVRQIPNITRKRQAAALQAEDMTVAELQQAAKDAGVDTTGLKTKQELTDAVRSAAKGT
jgi:hypothetical protein